MDLPLLVIGQQNPAWHPRSGIAVHISFVHGVLDIVPVAGHITATE